MKLFRTMYKCHFDYGDENEDEEDENYEYQEPKLISEKGLFNLQELELSKYINTVGSDYGEEDCEYDDSFPGSYFYDLRYLLSK